MLNIRKYKFLSRKSFFGKIARLPLQLFPSKMVMTILSGPLTGKKWINGSHNRSVWLGIYERSQTALFVEKVKGKQMFWDLGAHAGYYTLLYNVRNPSGRSFSFEPLPRNTNYFKKHIQLNNITNNTLLEVAVFNTAGKLKFSEEKTSVASKLSEKGKIEVDTIKLSDWFASNKISRPELIKMDIEGAEIDVLQDIKTILENSMPVLFLSTHGQKVHEACIQLLQELGYRLTPIDDHELLKAREILAEK